MLTNPLINCNFETPKDKQQHGFGNYHLSKKEVLKMNIIRKSVFHEKFKKKSKTTLKSLLDFLSKKVKEIRLKIILNKYILCLGFRF